jgi:hypothetical protein
MLTLLSRLEQECRRRDLVADDEKLAPASAFALVRDLPYQRASSREPEAIVREWRGTCSGKHYLLDAVFRELGMDARVIMCTHRFTRENTGHFPAGLKSLVSREPVPDVHTYIRLETGVGWMNVDGTWPSRAASLGMPVNRTFTEGQDMAIACDPIDSFVVPTGDDPQVFKEQLIAEFCGSSSTIRDEFIEGMSRWLSDATQG